MYQNIYGVAFKFLKAEGHQLVTQLPLIFWQLHNIFRKKKTSRNQSVKFGLYDTQFNFRAVAECMDTKTEQKS